MDHRPPRPDQPYAWDDERLSAYLDGELSAPEQAQLEARLVVDPELRQLVDELRAVRQQLEILPEYRLQATFAEQVLRRAEQEMLLSPLGRETNQSMSTPIAAAAVDTPSIPAAVVTPAATPMPQRSMARRWQRGVIWTAVAAAAVLLLIVTNQPRVPEQDHIALHDSPKAVTGDNAVAKTGTAIMPSSMAKPTVADSAKLPEFSGNSAQGFGSTQVGNDKQQNEQFEAHEAVRKKTLPDPKISSADSPVNNSTAIPAVVAADAQNSAPKPADAITANPDPNHMARAAGVKMMNATTPGNVLLKNQAVAPPVTLQEKQSAQLHLQLSTKLAALLASEEFANLTAPQDEKNNNALADDELLVVHLTPLAENKGDRSFESLLASNSIQLADKSLAQSKQANRQRTLATPKTQSEYRAAEPLAKTSSDKKQDAVNKDRKSSDMRETGKSKGGANGSAPTREKSTALASELQAEHDKDSADELYYLEADAGQIEELLRQLRAAPDRFSRLRIAARGLPQTGERANFRDEKSPAPQTSPLGVIAESNPADSKLGTDPAHAGNAPHGKQQPEEQNQLAHGAPLDSPAGAQSAGASAPPAAPAAEPAAMPFAAPSPAAPPPPTPVLPAKPLPSAAKPSDAQAAIAGVAAPNPGLPNAGQAIEGHTLANEEKDVSGTDSRSSRRAVQTDKSLEQATSDHAIAYRLRGVESLKLTKNVDTLGRNQDAGGGFGGGAGKAGKAEFGMAKTSEAEKTDVNGNPSATMRPSAAAGEQKSDSVAPGQAANDAAALPATPKAESIAHAPQESAVPKKGAPQTFSEQKLPQEVSQRTKPGSDTDRQPATRAESQRLLTGNKETVTTGERPEAEAAKKSAPATSKRIRVLFVVEHESTKE